MIKSGIKQIKLHLLKSSNIFFHNNGIFESKMNSHSIFANSRKEIDLDLDFTVYNILDTREQPCGTETGFDKDACIEQRSVWPETQSVESTLYPDVLKIKTIIVVKQNL